MSDREALGRRVREIWVAWASEQPDPKPSWLEGWEELDGDQREVDMRIGEGIAAAERERIKAGLPGVIRKHREDLLYTAPEARGECYGKLLARLNYLVGDGND